MTPHVCPECGGEGRVEQRCTACGGTGAVWRRDEEPAPDAPCDPCPGPDCADGDAEPDMEFTCPPCMERKP